MYVLIEVVARYICAPKFFTNYTDAYNEMKKRFYKNVCSNGMINEHEAYGKTKNNVDIDWKIF